MKEKQNDTSSQGVFKGKIYQGRTKFVFQTRSVSQANRSPTCFIPAGSTDKRNEYLIGSCKFRNEAVGVNELELLKKYANVFRKGKRYHYYIFSKGGFTEGLKAAADRGEVKLITLDDMY